MAIFVEFSLNVVSGGKNGDDLYAEEVRPKNPPSNPEFLCTPGFTPFLDLCTASYNCTKYGHLSGIDLITPISVRECDCR